MLLARQKAMVADISLADTYVMCPIRKNNKTTIKILLFNMACSHIPELHLPSLPEYADPLGDHALILRLARKRSVLLKPVGPSNFS